MDARGQCLAGCAWHLLRSPLRTGPALIVAVVVRLAAQVFAELRVPSM